MNKFCFVNLEVKHGYFQLQGKNGDQELKKEINK